MTTPILVRNNIQSYGTQPPALVCHRAPSLHVKLRIPTSIPRMPQSMQRIKLEARQYLSAAVHVARRQALGHIPTVQILRGKRTQIHRVSVVGVLIRLIWDIIGARDNLVRVVAHVLLVVVRREEVAGPGPGVQGVGGFAQEDHELEVGK